MLFKTERYIALALGCMLICSACSSNDAASVAAPEPQVKTPIELTVGIMGENPASISRAATRGVVTTDKPYGKQADAFSNTNTNLYMVMMSDDIGTTPSAAKYTRTMGVPAAKVGENKYNAVNFTGSYIRYWEDGHSRNSALSIYAACVPGQATALTIASSTTYDSNSWSTDAITPTIAWPLSGNVADQSTGDFLAKQDLCFSNNVSYPDGGTDNRVKFNNDTSNKFDRNKRLYFYHALTKVTFKIIKGTGFGDGANEFQFSDANKNIELVGFNTGGTFNIASGVFISTTTDKIEKFADTKQNDTENYVLTAFLVPGTDLNGTDKDALDKINFTIDDNQYHVTKGQLKEALSTTLTNGISALDENKMRPGVHYIFTMTVGKTAINQLTAAVVDWEEVDATVTPSNARVTVDLLDASDLTGSTKKTGDATFALYRSTTEHSAIADNDHLNYDWTKGYVGNAATLTWDTGHKHYSTTWIWPDNKTFYHLRAVSPADHTVATNTTPAPDEDYITLTGAASYTDVQWGAPFWNTTGKLTYSQETGFDNEQNHGQANESHQIYKAIGATTQTIKLVMFHMMSDVTIKLTSTAPTEKQVNLAGATLSLTKIYPTANVRMGDGLVTPTGTQATVNGTVSLVESVYQWHYGFVPQSLDGGTDSEITDDVVLTIKTADNNQYIVEMKDVLSASVGSNLIANSYAQVGEKYRINRWLSNYKYTYTFNLTKTGVEKMTATLADWEKVTASDEVVIR